MRRAPTINSVNSESLLTVWLVCIGVLLSNESLAQGTLFAVSGQGRGGGADARQAAEISSLQNEINKRDSCQSAGLLYSPGHAEADADGCIVSGAGVAGVPSGAILSFNLASCPDGWSPYTTANGRFIVGTGPLGSDNYALGQTGGSARHTLTVGEMPSHDHDVGIPGWTPSYVEFDYVGGSGSLGGVKGDGLGPFLDIYPRGGSQPHENRPPYIALLYCRKD